MEFPRARILVFTKAPVPGQVKTRLMPRYGAIGAARIHAKLARRALAIAAGERLAPVELWCAPHARHPFFLGCRRDYGVILRRQTGSDLGRRMEYALATALRDADYAILIGTDVPSVNGAVLRMALAALADGHDAVLGPTEDGGYGLIGLRRRCPPLFRAIAWGTPSVLAATRLRLRRARADWVELAPLWDVDHPADVRRYQRFYGNDSVV